MSQNWLEDFMRKNPVPQQSLEHFSSVEWTKRYLEDPAYHPIPTFSRVLKPDGEDFFFSDTLNTKSTIPHCVCMKLKDFVTPDISQPSKGEADAVVVRKAPYKAPPNPDCVFLLYIGERGLDGHPSVLHGGVCCALLDEMMGFMAVLHNYNHEGPERKTGLFTINLNVTYRAPVVTPGEIILRTWLVRREGRKWFLRGQIVNKDEVVCTEAEGLWVAVPRQKL